VSGRQPIERRIVERADAVDAVARRDRYERLDRAAVGSDEGCESRGRPAVGSDDTAEQRSPREEDGHEVGPRTQLGRRHLGRSHREQRVRQAAPPDRTPGASGRLGHR
jgi:hypothetical protein